MARNLKWQLCFKSLKNADCHIDIYQEGYTGTTVKQLTGAESPFVYEEDDDTNLLSFIRVKTAYMRVIETEFGELNELSPDTSMKHFVKAYYGGTVNKDATTGVWSDGRCVFVGYMQAAEYGNDWAAAPQEKEYAITSPLGLINELTFSVMQEPGLVQLGTIMKQVLDGLNSEYTSVIYPVNSEYPWSASIFYSVLCPYNPSFRHYDAQSDLFSPNTYKFFLDGICANYGWILHDSYPYIVFEKFDADVNQVYSKIDVNNLISLTGRSIVGRYYLNVNTYFNVSGDNGKQTVERPLKKLTINYEGGLYPYDLNTDHTITYEGGTYIVNTIPSGRYVILQNISSEVDGYGIGVTTIGNDHTLQGYGLFAVAYGTYDNNGRKVSLSPFWVTKYKADWPSLTKLIHWRCFAATDVDDGCILLKLSASVGNNLANINGGNYSMFLVIKGGNQYYDITNEEWKSNIVYNDITISGGDVVPNHTLSDFESSFGYERREISDVEGILIYTTYNVLKNLEILVYSKGTGMIQDGKHIKWGMSLVSPSTIEKDYVNRYNFKESEEIKNIWSDGYSEAEITVNIQDSFYCSNYFCKEEYEEGLPTFDYLPYMKAIQWNEMPVQRSDVSSTSDLREQMYIARWYYTDEVYNWHLISCDFDFREDSFFVKYAHIK